MIICFVCCCCIASDIIFKPAYSELVSKPGNREGCSRKGIGHQNTLGCMAGLTLTLICVAAADLCSCSEKHE